MMSPASAKHSVRVPESLVGVCVNPRTGVNVVRHACDCHCALWRFSPSAFRTQSLRLKPEFRQNIQRAIAAGELDHAVDWQFVRQAIRDAQNFLCRVGARTINENQTPAWIVGFGGADLLHCIPDVFRSNGFPIQCHDATSSNFLRNS
jgi:hypothetical protein